ncbi:MAG: putative sulfate exporter family transporter [Nitrosomonas sp.]|nr:putative sulfate exporter family transporter [Nitrosomonas sp.]
MVYTQNNPALFIIGLSMLAIGYGADTGLIDPVLAHLASGKSYKYRDELTTLPLYFGVFAAVTGLWHWLGKHREGHLDYYSSTIAGGMLILFITMLVRWFIAPEIEVISVSLGEVGSTGKYAHDLFGLNYVVLGIVAGLLIVNVFRVPSWAENGVRLSRLGLKTGVILLGALYSAAELKNLGGLSILMIGFFVLGSVGIVLWIGSRRRISNSMGGVLSAGMGVCGVSATVAVAPVVQAKPVEIAYTIGTILLWGVGCMFLFPIAGHLLDMSYVQFGAWAGTGILNSAQVAGAALAFQPDGIETLMVAEIFNITRVLILPVVVLWLAVWYVRKEGASAAQVDVGRVVITKFPVFVIGFILMFALSTTGIFAPANHYQGKYFGNTTDLGFKEENLLNAGQIQLLRSEMHSIEHTGHSAALKRLIEHGKIMSVDDDNAIRSIVSSDNLSDTANKILNTAHKAVHHTAKKIEAFREWITWLFAFGLVGLGMQITVGAMKQAGGEPAIIGGIVGFIKAALSLVVVMLFISETV